MAVKIDIIIGRILVVAAWLSLEVVSWSWSSKDSTLADSRSSQAQKLQSRLLEGKSRFQPGIQVISEPGNDECGIKLEDWKSQSTEEDVIFVHRSEFLTPQSGLDTPVGQALYWYLSQAENSLSMHKESLPRIYLAIYLALHHQGLLAPIDESLATSSYLSTLPSQAGLSHIPVFWDDMMLEELQCSTLKQAVNSRKAEWGQEFLIIRAALQAVGLTQAFRNLTLESWFWARSIITSRGFTDSNGQPCLCPYVDLMNHITNVQSEDTNQVLQCQWNIDESGYHLRLPDLDNQEKRGMVVSSPRLEISYGCHSNAHFLMNYGFALADDIEEEEASTCTLPLMLPASVHDHATESLWESDGLGDCHKVARIVTVGIGNAGPMESVLSLCRVASAQDRELSRMKEEFIERDEQTTQCDDGLVPQLGATLCRAPFSVSNEIQALKMLKEATQTALGRYSTTMEQDSDMLISGKRSESKKRPRFGFFRSMVGIFLGNNRAAQAPTESDLQWRNAVTVRREEKRILNHYFLLASIGLSILEKSRSGEDFSFETYKGMLDASLHDRDSLLVA